MLAARKASIRSAHLLHRPQCSPAAGAMQENVSPSGKSLPSRITSILLGSSPILADVPPTARAVTGS